MSFKEKYEKSKLDRDKLNIPPLALSPKFLTELINELKSGSSDSAYLIKLLETRVNVGVDDSSYVKANFLNEILTDKVTIDGITKEKAITMLGDMKGGFNVMPLVEMIKGSDEKLAQLSANMLKNTILVYDVFNDIVKLSSSNKYAKEILTSWAEAEWFTSLPKVSQKITMAVFKVSGETNTDDLSPAQDAFSRADIPLHSLAMLTAKMPDVKDILKELRSKCDMIAYVGDVVGTGSSRKSAINSIQWVFGSDIKGVPNKRNGGVIIGQTMAPIFYNTALDSGVLPIVAEVTSLNNGDIMDIYPYEGKIEKDGKTVSTFKLESNTVLDEVRAGGRILLIIGRGLTNKAREALKLEPSTVFAKPIPPVDSKKGYSLAQKMVGKACNMDGVRAGAYVEPTTTTVGSQDTTGAMTRDEIKELSALGFNADFVLQSFCHTAAYPKPTDIDLQHNLPDFIRNRGGVSLKPGDGIIHSWLNRMLLPDTVGTGGDSHTRFPIGISFPAGSGLVAFAAVTGAMPLTMPESVLVRFSGTLRKGITLRDMVNAIPYYAIKQGLLTVEKKNKKNIFAGKVLEIEGLSKLKVEQAFELSDASAERSCAGCTVALDKEPIIEYLNSNVVLIDTMIKNGYGDADTLKRRRDKMKEWLANPTLLKADSDAEYSAIIEINMDEITEPILACPNDPDNVATLSEVLADSSKPHKIDEVFVGSCMTNIGHHRALGNVLKGKGPAKSVLWVVPPTKMDEQQLIEEGYYSLFGAAGARTELPGCSLCMGNQARVKDGAVVFSTSTRNFDNRMGKDALVYLGSAELAAVCALYGKIPTKEEYLSTVGDILDDANGDIYKYLNFNKIENFNFKR